MPNGNVPSDTVTPGIVTSLPLREPRSSADPSSLQSPTNGLFPLVGVTDLTIGPSQTKAINLTCIPREAGEARVASITMMIEEEKFDLIASVTRPIQDKSYWWRQSGQGVAKRQVGMDRDTGKCRILPKPPKIRISTPNLKETYYTNEEVILEIGIHNDESEPASVLAEARLFGSPDAGARLLWHDEKSGGNIQDNRDDSDTEGTSSNSLSRHLGVIDRFSEAKLAVLLTNTKDASDYELEIVASYRLLSDMETPIVKAISVDLTFIRPFEANYELLTRLHPLEWPDFFYVDTDQLPDKEEPKPQGLWQRWCLSSTVVSFALEPLIIEDMSLVLLELKGAAVCQVEREASGQEITEDLFPREVRQSRFIVDIQKPNMGDRRSTSLDLALDVKWRRRDSNASDKSTIFTLEIPRFLVPMSEPRVLATSAQSPLLPGLVHVDYTLENPSMHFLTFSLTMEASEQFAFSGPKATVIQLVPLSRFTVRYNLLSPQQGLWIQPQLVVVDTFFNKTLRVLPTEDMRATKKGIMVWVDVAE